jgi:hypothetical protein
MDQYVSVLEFNGITTFLLKKVPLSFRKKLWLK